MSGNEAYPVLQRLSTESMAVSTTVTDAAEPISRCTIAAAASIAMPRTLASAACLSVGCVLRDKGEAPVPERAF